MITKPGGRTGPVKSKEKIREGSESENRDLFRVPFHTYHGWLKRTFHFVPKRSTPNELSETKFN